MKFSTWELKAGRSDILGHFCLHSEVKIHYGYIRHCLKKIIKKKKKKKRPLWRMDKEVRAYTEKVLRHDWDSTDMLHLSNHT